MLSGLAAIHAYGRAGYFMGRMYGLIDNSARTAWALEFCSHWMTFRMGVLGVLSVAGVGTAEASAAVLKLLLPVSALASRCAVLHR